MHDPFDLSRFVEAQDRVYDDVLRELRAGRKRTHWMWFVFPQLKALGRSPTAHLYGIGSLDEAMAYLAHPVLGRRIRECARLVAAIEGSDIERIMGSPDDLKLRSSMTLFARAGADDARDFHDVLTKFYSGPDPATDELLSGK